MAEEKPMTEQESLQLIGQMLHKAKNSFHDTGIGPMLWGTVIIFCSLVTYWRIVWDKKLLFDVWLLTLIAIVPQIWITIYEKKQRRARNYDDRTIDFVWLFFGISIFLLSHINTVMINKLLVVFREYKTAIGNWPDFRITSYTSAMMLMLYGIPTITTGAIMRFKPMLWGGIIGWICCVISVYTSVDIDMLLTAFAALVMWLIPGIILWQKSKKRKTADV
jgi:ABC-type Mn2+/Zn2+ transport system permease subunit